MASENIFSALEKDVGENYLTEAFVFLVNHLLAEERTIALEILTQLCVNNNEFCFDANEAILVSTQETTEQGRPDIKVSSPNKLIYIEVKDYSLVDPEQLKRYKKDLELSSTSIKKLILLTRHSVDSREHQDIPDKHVRWFDIHNWLASIGDKVQDPVSVYLIDSFKSFLEVRQMSIQKVGWEYINGVPALNNLITMIEVAVQGANLSIYGKSAGWDFKGFWLENKEFACYVYYDNHLLITFELVDKNKYDTELLGECEYEMRKGKERLWFRLPLEDMYFFSLDKDKQLEEIAKFVKTAYAEAQQMRVKGK